MKKALCILLVALLVALMGCSEPEGGQQINVTITDSNVSTWHQFVVNGKYSVKLYHMPTYKIYYEYEGNQYVDEGLYIYKKYKDLIGKTVSATVYRDNETITNIVLN